LNRYAVKQSRGLDGPFIFTSASCAICARIQAAGNTRDWLKIKNPDSPAMRRAREGQF
jgi:hypothetical protein